MTHYLGYEKGQAPSRDEDQKPKTTTTGPGKRASWARMVSWKSKCRGTAPGSLILSLSAKDSGDFAGFGGFDQKIYRHVMYAQGMTVRKNQRCLEEQYKVEV
jgi:hypothetical protein